MKTRPRERGMTLIEILIALIVMVLGVLGILALFPPSLEMAKESMEETNAAILAESVADSLMEA
ncbi:MAG TPA: prepilin-type N-terminal cleavage/methylation domain-containing protein, partial [Planctomycetota bacterium]|nr:prepilin-type N-terminal cleavage/methylation domain-containing protein [Planctomycetota bacterium]